MVCMRRPCSEEEILSLYQNGNLTGNSKSPLKNKNADSSLSSEELWDACRSRGMSAAQSGSLVVIHNGFFGFFINMTIVLASLAVVGAGCKFDPSVDP